MKNLFGLTTSEIRKLIEVWDIEERQHTIVISYYLEGKNQTPLVIDKKNDKWLMEFATEGKVCQWDAINIVTEYYRQRQNTPLRDVAAKISSQNPNLN